MLVSSEHYVRTLVLDDQQFVSLNSTSLAVKVRPSDEKLAKVFYAVKGEKEEGYGHY